MMRYEFLYQNLEPRARHSPEKRKKDSFHPLRSKYPREDQKREEDQEIQTAHRLLPKDPVAEEQLGVPGDKGLIEIKKRKSTRSLPFNHQFKGKGVIVSNEPATRSSAGLSLATEIVVESALTPPR